ncbi:MAG: CHAT domain-containing protein [Candidatus Obscuribacterales bacterium]|nr:CHAT domain-containing protein [Candidatus Obscuribacterales bacterium]
MKSSFLLAGLLTLSLQLLAFAQLENLRPPFSTNAEIRRQEEELERKLKKSTPVEQSDALYETGKAAFEGKEYDRALYYMKESLALDAKLKRPEYEVKTRVAMAIIYALKQDNKAALDQYKEALNTAEANKLDDFVQIITDSLGTLALRLSLLDEAESYYKKAYALGVLHKNKDTQINSLINQATVMRKRKKIAEAKELLGQAVVIAGKGKNSENAGAVLLNLARVQHDLGEFSECEDTYTKAVAALKAEGNHEQAASASWGLAETLYDRHRLSQAKAAFLQAKALLDVNAPLGLFGPILLGLGAIEADLGNFDSAVEYHKQALVLAVAAKNKIAEMQCILQLGSDYLLRGNPETGLEQLLSGESLLEQKPANAASRATLFMAIGRCYKVLGQFEQAQKYYDSALKLFQDAGDQVGQALALNSMAVLSLDNQNQALFERYYKQAKEIYASLNNKRDLAILDYNYAQFLLTQKRFKEAIELYNQALGRLKETEDVYLQSMVLSGLGLAELLSENTQAAIAAYTQSLKIAEQSGSIEAQWDANLGLGKCYKKQGQNDPALLHLKKAVDLVEAERAQLTRDSFKTYNLDLRNDCFSELIDLYAKLNRPYEALEIAEKGRARAFLDMLASRKSGGQIIETFQPVSNNSSNITKSTPVESGTRAVGVIRKNGQINVATSISPVNVNAPDIEEIKNLVRKSNSYVVEYYLLPDKVMVWLIDPQANIRLLPPIMLSKQQVGEKVTLAYEAVIHAYKQGENLGAVNQRRYEHLQELYRLFIQPCAEYLPKDTKSVVTIVPHGPMFLIPFAALVDADGSFLVEKHTLSYIPAIGVFRTTQKLADSASSTKKSLLAFGNPITKAISFLGALPYAEKEVKEIAQIFGPQNSLVKIGQEADKKTFCDLSSQYSDIHLATHGLIDEENPMQSSLVLAPTAYDDGLLSVKDILSLKELKARLVALSACQTGRGKITGDGVVGLSRAFIIAGAPSVLVSQWNVDDIVTEYQMKHFYKTYLSGSSKCHSLREAQLATIQFLEGGGTRKTGGARANPKYWGAFQLIGEAQ